MIGTDVTGQVVLGNTGPGIILSTANTNLIGGAGSAGSDERDRLSTAATGSTWSAAGKTRSRSTRSSTTRGLAIKLYLVRAHPWAPPVNDVYAGGLYQRHAAGTLTGVAESGLYHLRSSPTR